MAIPSGYGTEVLKRTGSTLQNEIKSVLVVPTDHICTILSFTLNVDGTGTASFYVQISDGTSPEKRILRMPSGLTDHQTFIWNDKLVLNSGDILKFEESANVACKYWISYIDQDWDSS